MFDTSCSSIFRTESVKGPVALITHLALTSNSCPVKENSINHILHLFFSSLTLWIINLSMKLIYCEVCVYRHTHSGLVHVHPEPSSSVSNKIRIETACKPGVWWLPNLYKDFEDQTRRTKEKKQKRRVAIFWLLRPPSFGFIYRHSLFNDILENPEIC